MTSRNNNSRVWEQGAENMETKTEYQIFSPPVKFGVFLRRTIDLIKERNRNNTYINKYSP